MHRILLAVASLIALACGPAHAVWMGQNCPTWSAGGVSGLYADPTAAALAAARKIGGACAGVSMSCAPTANGAGYNYTVYSCTNPQNCGATATGTAYTSVYQFGSDVHCAAFVPDNGKNLGPPPCPDCSQGNPINGAVGNKFQSEVDFKAGGLEFVRTYNSLYPGEHSALGHKWRHNWDRKVFSMSANAQIIRGDGKRYFFTPPSSGNVWVGDPDVLERLESVSGGWKVTTGADEVELYNSAGKLVSVASASGEVTTLGYSDGTSSGANGAVYDDAPTAAIAPGLLIRVTDFRGRSLTLTYKSNDTLARMIDPAGQVYEYTVGTTTTAVKYPTLKTRTYVYNEAAYTSFPGYPAAALTGIVDEKGVRFAIFKYENDLAKSTEHAGGVNTFSFTYSGTRTYTDPLNTSRTVAFTTTYGVTRRTSTTQPCPGCTPSTSTETYTLDANGNLASKKDFNGNLACYTFDTTRNLETARTEGLNGAGTCSARQTSTATRTITTEWHPTRRLQKRVAEPLRITTYAYHGETGVSCAPTGSSENLLCSKTVQATTDADGSLAFSATSSGSPRTWAYTYNASGQILTVDGPRTDVTDVTTYAYYTSDDPSGNYRAGDLASITNALSQVKQFTQYDGSGRLKKSIDPNGLETILDYWPRGWLKSRQVGTSGAGYETTSFDYDDNGALTKVTAPDSSYVQYTYDDAHRLWKISDGLGNRIEYALDNAGNRTAENAYDTGGVLVRAHSRVFDVLSRVSQDIGGTNPAGQITGQAYDAKDNLKTITDPLSRVTTQIFDRRDRLTEVRDPFNGTTAPTLYEYNQLDQLTKVTDPEGLATTYTVNGHGETISQASPDTGTTTFAFDAASNLATKLDARGIQATFSYDALNRLTQIVYPDQTVTYTWDSCTNGVGRICSISDSSGTTSYAYSVQGRVTAKSQVVAGLTQAMGYAYNSAGQLATVTTPSGRSVVYTYANNRPVSVTVNGQTVIDSVIYEPFGPAGGWTWGNSAPGAVNTHTRVFDKDFRTTRVTSDLPAAGGQPAFDRQFGWDNMSRVTSLTDLANSALSATYGYDALDRLNSASQGTSSWGYGYSGVGDRTTSTVNSSTTTYGYFTGTHRLQSLSGAQTKSYTFDGAGNMTSDGTTTWTFGGNNRPTAAGSTTFAISALGQRVRKVGTSTTRYVYDESGRLWGEYSDTGALIQETIWLDDLPVATLRPNGGGFDIFYVHADQLGTPRTITRPSDNAIVWRWDNTEAFGNSAPNENPSGLGTFAYNLRFPGQYFDLETGTNYNYFRDYDPRIGRYVQSDPIGLKGGVNTYAYVGGDPLSLFDPRGLANSGPWPPRPMPPASCEFKCNLLVGIFCWTCLAAPLDPIARGACAVECRTVVYFACKAGCVDPPQSCPTNLLPYR